MSHKELDGLESQIIQSINNNAELENALEIIELDMNLLSTAFNLISEILENPSNEINFEQPLEGDIH